MMPFSAIAEGTSPWLPAPGQFTLGINHTQQTAKESIIGDKELSVWAITGAAEEYKSTTNTVQFTYGLLDSLSFDLAAGQAKVEVGSADSSSGRIDTVIGGNWRVLDEYISSGVPTLTLRAAAILKGNYEGARLAGLGKAANGLEVAAIVGKQISPMFSLWGEIGVQNRDNSVPNATFYDINAGLAFTRELSASIGVSNKKYSGDLDIGGAGFSPSRFPEVKEERSLIKLGLNYSFAENQGLSLNFAKITAGRNTVKDDRIISISYAYGFN